MDQPRHESRSAGFRIGVDIGGTFTDVVLLDEADGNVEVVKVPTVPSDPSEGFLHGLDVALSRFGVAPAAVGFLVHGTTVATNTIIQGQGARAGLITSAGFSDVLEIGYQTRPSLYELAYSKPTPLVPRHMTAGVPERIGPEGEVLVPLDEEATAAAARRLVAAGAEAIAIAFLHAYRDPTHERRAAEIVRQVAPGIDVVTSSGVCPEYREYPRTSTAVVNTVLVPRVAPYLARLETRLADLGLSAPLHLMTSSGGIMTSDTAKRLPVHLVESGPAAGVIGAAFVAEDFSDPDIGRRILALDIGGTTAKAALVQDGTPALAEEFEVGAAMVPHSTAARGQGYPVKLPVVSLVEIGAGGGSIAAIDPGGALAVGPQSAGAVPGPVCYGQGGNEPTITDANLVLGRLNPDFFLGGALKIQAEAAHAAIDERIARPLGLDAESAARMIIEIANAKMIAALQLISVRRGIDPREYTLVVSGGAGPVHAAAIARDMAIPAVLVPPTPGLNSALGLLAADIKHETVRSVFRPLAEIERGWLDGLLAELTQAGRGLLAAEHVSGSCMSVICEAEVCYRGQNYPLRIPVEPGHDGPAEIDAAFRAEHERAYGFGSATEDTALLNLRVTAVGRVDRPTLRKLAPRPAGERPEPASRRRVVFDTATDCPIYRRADLLAGDRIAGPAIIEQMDTTIVVPPKAEARVDAGGCLLIVLSDSAEGGRNHADQSR